MINGSSRDARILLLLKSLRLLGRINNGGRDSGKLSIFVREIFVKLSSVAALTVRSANGIKTDG